MARIVVLGAKGLLGSQIAAKLTAAGHEVVAASRRSGVDTITGDGLQAAFTGARAVVDAANSPSFEDSDVLEFFTTSTTNVLSAERAAGVGHHVAISIVGADDVPASGYLRAKAAQEALVRASGIPYTIIRSTQFFEFVMSIADSATVGGAVRLPEALVQPIAAADTAAEVERVVAEGPINRVLEVAGPEALGLDEFIRRGLRGLNDPREVITDPGAGYFGASPDARALIPAGDAVLGSTHFEEWLAEAAARS
jgi:uncharacterized protein YbjT (DUF2867 family)